MSRILTAILLLATTSLVRAGSFSPPPEPPVRLAPNEARDGFVQAAESLIARGIDAQRRKFAPDAPRLAGNSDLADIARRRSSDMADGAPFAHEDAQGRFVAADLVRARFGPY